MRFPIMLAPKGSANYLSFAMPAGIVSVRTLYDDGSVAGEKLLTLQQKSLHFNNELF